MTVTVTSYQAILEALPGLNKTQLGEVKKRVAHLLQGSGSADRAPVEDEDWLLLGIIAELQRRGLEADDRSQFVIKKSSSYASFSTASEITRGILLRAAPNLDAVERRLLGQIAGRELAKHLEGWHDPPEISLHNLLIRVGHVPVAIETAFPGYMASGMLSLVVR